MVSIGNDVDALLADKENAEWTKYSIEFCGGTHLSNSAEAGCFAIVAEEGIGGGVRRVVCCTGDAARAALGEVQCSLKCSELGSLTFCLLIGLQVADGLGGC